MLRPRTVLGEHARPVPPVGVHLDTPDVLHGSNTIEFAVANGCHRTPDFFDRVRIAGVLHHAKLVGTRMASDRPVTEIHAEEERVRDSIQSASLASGARRACCCISPPRRSVSTPLGDGRAVDPGGLLRPASHSVRRRPAGAPDRPRMVDAHVPPSGCERPYTEVRTVIWRKRSHTA